MRDFVGFLTVLICVGFLIIGSSFHAQNVEQERTTCIEATKQHHDTNGYPRRRGRTVFWDELKKSVMYRCSINHPHLFD